MARRTGIYVRVGKGGVKTYRAEVYSARDGKKIRKSFPTEAAARQWRADAQSAVSRGSMRAPTATTLRAAVAAWVGGARDGAIRTRAGDTFKPSTIRSYEETLSVKRAGLGGRSILEQLGAHKLSEIGRVELQDLADRLLAGGLDPSTVRNALMPLRAIYRRAFTRNEIAVNPTTALELPASRGRRDRIASPAEAQRLIGLVAARDRALWATAFYAGLRLGELLALRWEDVDLAGGVIRVERAYDMTARAFIEPKSRAGRRKVPLAAVLRDYLLEHKLGSRESGLVFGRTPELPFDYSSTMNRAKRAWKRFEVAPISLHEARHTFASLLIDANVNAKAISTFMGHSSIAITIDRYGHLMPGSEDEAAARIDAYLERANTLARLAQVDPRGPVVGQSAPLTNGFQRITADSRRVLK
ncbi:MAG: site-specific integrase [Gaiellaceae bacterium]